MDAVAQPLAAFRFARFRLAFLADEPLQLPPYAGSTLRGAFGHAFKRVVCAARGKECDACILKQTCAYSYIFLTPLPTDARMMRLYRAVPHPFVIEPPLGHEASRVTRPGEQFAFGLILIGKAIEYLPYFIYTFSEVGKLGLGRGRGRCSLTAVHQIGPDGAETAIYTSEAQTLRPGPRPTTVADLIARPAPSPRLAIQFLTPTRLKHAGQYTSDLDFRLLMSHVLRRLSTLSYFHCGQELALDFRGILGRAAAVKTLDRRLDWHDWERYSSRQKEAMKLGGFLGHITFDGDFAEFWPYLLLGEHVHIGKATTFGLGKYEIQHASVP